MKPTPFLVDCLSSPPLFKTEKQVENESLLWLPVIAGIATREEVEQLTMQELQVLFVVANKKIELMRGVE